MKAFIVNSNIFLSFLSENYNRTRPFSYYALICCICIGTVLIPASADFANEGMNLYSTGEFEKSIEWFENELKTAEGTERAPLLNNIGTAYLALNQIDEAEENFNEAVSEDPLYWVAWINLGAVHEEKGNTIEALESYTRAAEISNTDAGFALIKKGGLLTILGRYEEALDAYKLAESVVTGSDIAVLYTGIGAVYSLQQNYSAAEEAFNKAISSDPDNAALAYTNLGVLKAIQGLNEEATEAFEQANRIDPDGETSADEYLRQLDESGNITPPSS